MPIYLQAPGEGPATVHLDRWSIREFEGGARHFVGRCRHSMDGRVSTEILELDIEARTARTASGRHYILVGRCGHSSDGEYVFNRVCQAIGRGQTWRDVTRELIPDCRAERSFNLMKALAEIAGGTKAE